MSNKSFEIEETKKYVFGRDGYKCKYPGCESHEIQLAHKISQSKANLNMIRKLYPKIKPEKIIHHPMNFETSCAKHNSYFMKGIKGMIQLKLIAEIAEDLNG